MVEFLYLQYVGLLPQIPPFGKIFSDDLLGFVLEDPPQKVGRIPFIDSPNGLSIGKMMNIIFSKSHELQGGTPQL